MAKLIQLGGNRYRNKKVRGYAVVSDIDYDRLNKYMWSLSAVGYAVRRPKIDGLYKIIYMHRDIFNIPKNKEIDHINRNKLDSRRENLRICNSSQNKWNSTRKSNITGYKGVKYDKRDGRYYARIGVNGISISLGGFKDSKEAVLSYNKAAIKYHGEFAFLNNL